MARQIYLYLLAGTLSVPIFGSDWSPIRFRNIKVLSLKRAQSIEYISRLNKNYAKSIFSKFSMPNRRDFMCIQSFCKAFMVKKLRNLFSLLKWRCKWIVYFPL